MASDLRLAASVILYRQNPALEVFVVLRSKQLSFFGGYHAFPGGSIDASDGNPEDPRTLAMGAARELFEETGILRTTTAVSDEDWADAFRHELLDRDGDIDFLGETGSHGLEIDTEAFRPLCRMVTPKFSSMRFDTRFFMIESRPEDPTPLVLPGELDSGQWWTPSAILDAWRAGNLFIAPPILIVLETLAEHPLEEAISKLSDIPARYEGSGLAIRWTPGVEMLPVHSPPLPPSVPTNVFLIGHERFLVVDPAPSGSDEQAHLFAAIDRRIDSGHQLEAVLLTHHHLDHIGALDAVRKRYSLPVWTHVLTAKDYNLPLDRALEDGDWIDLGTAPDGHTPWGLRAIFTPGHAIGHLALEDPHYGVLIAGDLVSTIMSIFVGSPGGGHLRTYLDSLRKMQGVSSKILFPSHGPPTLDGSGIFDHTLDHRIWRLEKVLDAVGSSAENVEVIAERVYKGLDPKLRDLCIRTTRAALDYLAEEGKVVMPETDAYART